MLSILLHSSKTMRRPTNGSYNLQQAPLTAKATELINYLQTLNVAELASVMHISPKKAEVVFAIIKEWSSVPAKQLPALDAFIGDIYSGLQVHTFNDADRRYANEHLFILSGLYGVLRALDGVTPYRLEMGYRLPEPKFKNLYTFWDSDIARQIPEGVIINTSAVEYTKAVLPHLPDRTVITPKFLTKDSVGSEPKFVVVHAKIARGAFAHWLIKHRIQDTEKLKEFDELGYSFEPALSTPEQPTFVCTKFGGLGLSVRLT